MTIGKACTRPATRADLVPGALIRMTYDDGTVSGWSDCCIASVDLAADSVTLIRPRMTWNCGVPMVKAEAFEASIDKVVGSSFWLLVCNGRGNPENYAG